MGFAKAGAHVIALARTVGGLEELDDAINAANGSATLTPLDLTDFDAIDQLGAKIHERWGRLDILLGNAAMLGDITPLAMLEPAIFESVFALNVTANYRLIRSLDPLLRESESGRAIFVSSGAARSRKPFVSPYAASKAALEALVQSYAKEVQKTPIRANLFDPGIVRTKMRAQYAPGENPETLKEPKCLVPSLIDMCRADVSHNGALFHFPSQTFTLLKRKNA